MCPSSPRPPLPLRPAGCLEPYVYFGDVQARYAVRTGQRIDRDQFVALVQAKEPQALELVEETASVLALACSHWGILLDLDVITIGGFWGHLRRR